VGALSGDEVCAAPVMIVVAHPDDEVIMLGSRLPILSDATIVHVTDGAPRNGEDARGHGFGLVEEYARQRRMELLSALALAGIPTERTVELGFTDQEAALNLAELTGRVTDWLRKHPVEIVVTHAYEGGHPDHDATAFAVHAACQLIDDPIPIVEASSYHNSAKGIEVGCFLASNDSDGVRVSLTPSQRELKRRMMDCFATQKQTLLYFPVEVECFRLAPRYDFTSRPHQRVLFYEQFNWGMTGERFCTLAAEAQRALGIRGRM
jgi:LmbE family N-acetylglucosaminyl deacetylase